MIKLCKHNKYSTEISEFLHDHSIEHTIENCLGRCDLCHSGAFAKYGEVFITGQDGKALKESIKALL